MKKSNYWQRRIQEQSEKALERTQKETEKELSRIYLQTIEQVRDDILKVYSKVKSVKEGDEIQINDFYRNRRYWELFNTINKRLQALGQKQIGICEPALLELYQRTLEVLDEAVPKSKIHSSFLVPQMVDAKQALFQSWCLDGKNFSNRVWEDKSKMLLELKKQLNTFIIQGKSPWETAVGVSERLRVSESNAYRLMRTETAHAQIYAQTARYKEMGFTRGEWNADRCSCGHCKENDGKMFSLEELSRMIPAHPNCRCSFSVVVD